jgi:cytidine deaminase
MSEKHIQFDYLEFPDSSGLTENEQRRIEECIDFSKNAYAPYSTFNVSALVELTNGEVHKGTNVENSSYPVAICAERNLLSYVISNHPDAVIKTMFIYADADIGSVITPCGLCRQSLVEAEQRQGSGIKLYLLAKNGSVIIVERSGNLLPLHFDGKFLKKR